MGTSFRRESPVLPGGGRQGRTPLGAGPRRIREEIFGHSRVKKTQGLGSRMCKAPVMRGRGFENHCTAQCLSSEGRCAEGRLVWDCGTGILWGPRLGQGSSGEGWLGGRGAEVGPRERTAFSGSEKPGGMGPGRCPHVGTPARWSHLSLCAAPSQWSGAPRAPPALRTPRIGIHWR